MPEWKREPPKVDLSQLDPNNPELMLQASKKGRTLMMFATVSGSGNLYLTSLVIESYVKTIHLILFLNILVYFFFLNV